MNLSDSKISKLFIHFVGNKIRNEEFRISKRKVNIDDGIVHNRLTEFYLSPFLKVNEFYNFHHPSSLKFNEIYNYVISVFDDPGILTKISSDIAEHLYESSQHPKILGGELHIVHFKECVIDDKTVDAIGIFKTETKVNFIKLDAENNGYSIVFEEGINPFDGFDKGCLVFNTDKRDGYKLLILDNQSKSVEAQYWRDDFLKVRPCSDEYHNTSNYLTLCKDFLSKRLPEEFEVTKTDKIDLLNRSLEYFKENDTFNEKGFTESVFQDKEIIKSFKSFKSDYVEQHEIELQEEFDVSGPAVKKQSRIYKSVLKLDKNFHIYIHGNANLIEKGVDNRGRKYYKIFYEEES